MSETVEKKLYKGNCHCGKIRFTVLMPPLETTDVVSCNCSLCTKHALLNVYPDVTDITFTHGQDSMSEYFHSSKNIPLKFCPNCGTSIMADVSNTPFYPGKYSMSIRTFENIEDILDKLKYTTFDGKNLLEPKYSLPDV